MTAEGCEMDGQGKWLASDYMDCGAYGVLDYDNHIIVRSRHGLSRDECTDIAAAHNAVLAQARAEEREACAKEAEKHERVNCRCADAIATAIRARTT